VTRYKERDALELFNSGKAAFLRVWSSAYTGLVNSDGTLTVNHLPVGVAELPTFADQAGHGYSTIGGWNLFVNPKIKENRSKMEAVSAFIEWITDVPGQHILAQYGETPANVSVRGMDEWLRDNPVLSMSDRARPVRPPHELPTYHLLSEAIYTEVHRALTGELSPEAAMVNAENRINRVLAG
jgi:multiple sugar transport system substrate-binding protein